MGLDMYLNKKFYIGAEFNHRKIAGTINLTKEGKAINIDPTKVCEISQRAAYWRKANQIHRWFVENVQDGKDECEEHEVDIEQLKELVQACKNVLADPKKASEMLPTASGFFFGGTDYDEWYLKELQDTIDMLQPAIDSYSDDDDAEFTYRSSW